MDKNQAQIKQIKFYQHLLQWRDETKKHPTLQVLDATKIYLAPKKGKISKFIESEGKTYKENLLEDGYNLSRIGEGALIKEMCRKYRLVGRARHYAHAR